MDGRVAEELRFLERGAKRLSQDITLTKRHDIFLRSKILHSQSHSLTVSQCHSSLSIKNNKYSHVSKAVYLHQLGIPYEYVLFIVDQI